VRGREGRGTRVSERGAQGHCSTVVEGGRVALRRVAENVMGGCPMETEGCAWAAVGLATMPSAISPADE
jgi:hypothetical protein